MISPKALIFDVDGTMAETEELHRLSFNAAFREFGLSWSWDRAMYKKLLATTGGKERIAVFQDVHSLDATKLNVQEIANLHGLKTVRFADLMKSAGCPLRPGVKELIVSAREEWRDLAIATTTSRANVEALLSPALGPCWSGLFKAIVCGEDVQRKKPDPEVYLKALASLAWPAGSCLAFEDSRNGLMSARAAGIPVVISKSMYFDDEQFDGALCVVNDLSEFALDSNRISFRGTQTS